MKTGLIILGGIVGIVAIILICIFSFGLLSNGTANFRGNVAKNNLTKANGQYRISSYETFFGLCASAQTDQQNIPLDQQALATDIKGTQQYVIDRQTLIAIESDLNRTINTYNATSSEAGTVAQFKASSLPPQLSRNQEIKCN